MTKASSSGSTIMGEKEQLFDISGQFLLTYDLNTFNIPSLWDSIEYKCQIFWYSDIIYPAVMLWLLQI